MTIGEKIKELRKLKKMTITQLSNMVGVTPSAISDYENNKIKPVAETLYKLSLALEKTMEYFMEGSVVLNFSGNNNTQTAGLAIVAKSDIMTIDNSEIVLKLQAKIEALNEKLNQQNEIINQLNEEVKKEKDEKYQLLTQILKGRSDG